MYENSKKKKRKRKKKTNIYVACIFYMSISFEFYIKEIQIQKKENNIINYYHRKTLEMH